MTNLKIIKFVKPLSIIATLKITTIVMLIMILRIFKNVTYTRNVQKMKKERESTYITVYYVLIISFPRYPVLTLYFICVIHIYYISHKPHSNPFSYYGLKNNKHFLTQTFAYL